jgi:hypothetical protein
MMMRPRNYGIINRSIARGISYSLRSYKPTPKEYKKPEPLTNADIVGISSILAVVFVIYLFVMTLGG